LLARNTRCTSCHSGRYASGALNLGSRDVAYAALVGVTAAGDSCAGSGEVLVTPGDVSASLLYAKLARTQDCGMFMPPLEGSPPPAYGSSGFTAEQLAVVSAWIEAGAVNH